MLLLDDDLFEQRSDRLVGQFVERSEDLIIRCRADILMTVLDDDLER